MSLLIKRTAFFFSALLFFFACEDPTNIGEELEPQNQNFGVLFADTFSIRTSTVLADSIQTLQSPYFLLGNYDDPKLGRVTARSFLQARLDAAYNLGGNTQLESLRLILFCDYAYGDTSLVQELQVHRLTDSIRIFNDGQGNPGDPSHLRTYYNYDQIAYDPAPVGTATYQPRPNTVSDSLIIPLSNELGQYLLSLSGNNGDQFQQNFFGLAFTPGPSSSNALVTGFNAFGRSRMELAYKDSTGTSRVYRFSLQRLWFNQIQSDRSNTPVAGLVNGYDALPSAATSEETYVQGGTGLMTKVELPTLKHLLDSGDATVNRVELVMEPAAGSVSSTAPPRGLALYQVDPQTNQLSRLLVVDPATNRNVRIAVPLLTGFASSSLPQITGYNTTTQAYRFDITSVVQTYLFQQKKLSPEQRTNLAAYVSVPSNSLNTLYSSREQSVVPASIALESTVNRLVIRSRSNGENAIKLRVYYTRQR